MAGEEGHQTAGGEGGAGPISKLCNNKRQNLGSKWSMYKVGTTALNNLDKPYGLVDSKNNNNNFKTQNRTNTSPGFCCLYLTIFNRALCILN